jgi:hypothetical protein
MRQFLVAAAVVLAGAGGAVAQSVDRYGGVGNYPMPAAASQPARVLSWPGKQIAPTSPPQVGGYGYPRYVQAQPAYGNNQLAPAPYAQGRGAPPAPYQVDRRMAMYPQPRYAQPQYAAPQYATPQYAAPQYGYPQPRPYASPAQPQAPQPPRPAVAPQASYPSPYQPQPYYAPAPAAAPRAPGSTATAPSGVYPPNTVPPQLAGPNALPPQVAQPMVANPQLPSSIYAPPPPPPPPPAPAQGTATGAVTQADPTDPRQPQRVAMNTAEVPVQTARHYSLHRQYGLEPDPTPPPPPDEGATVELVSPIDSGVGGEPETQPRNKVIQTKGKTGTAIVRAAREADPDVN